MKHALHLVYDSEVNPGKYCSCEKCKQDFKDLTKDIQREIDREVIRKIYSLIEEKN